MSVLQAVIAANPPAPAVETQELVCLAQNVWYEARGSSIEDKLAVAHVTLNRVERREWADTICGVVWQDRQFSWTHDGKADHVDLGDPINPIDREAWETTALVALAAAYGTAEDPTDGATHYHASYVSPAWADRLEFVIQIDDHLFYRD
jgi:spore germination cell wall hydrolase CwlJ-like protein